MSQQPNLFSPQAPGSSPVIAGHSESPGTPEQTPRWLRRLDLFVRIIVRLYLGLIVIVLPWLHFWDDNHLLVVFPYLSPLALNGITRGIVSGLGILNIYIAIHDAIHYREI
jgi:hypothetical protein